MPSFKLLAICVSLTCSAVLAGKTAAQEPIPQSKARLEKQLEALEKNGNLPFELPEAQKEKMREALTGKGEYAIPRGSMKDSNMPEQERKNIRKVLEKMEREKVRMEKNGAFKGLDEQTQKKRAAGYKAIAESVASNSQSGLERALQEYGGTSKSEAGAFIGRGDPTTKREMTKGGVIFASFSMEDDALKNLFIRAKQQDAEVYFKGMHPSSKMINETMEIVRRIGRGIDNPPMARFNPDAFDKYSVTQVPTILYKDGDSYAMASGLLNLGWLKDKADETDENLELGNFGPTSRVIEKSILEVFKERLARIDWEKKKERTKRDYWKKRDFHTLPRADENKTFFIDPTVKANSDIKTPQGDVIARRGEIINPLKNRSIGLTMLVFDAQDTEQVEWVASQLTRNDLKGNVMVMTTRLSRNNGWDHLQSLQDHFKRRIFLLPKEMISKFKLTGAPALITTELEKELMKIQQFKVEE